MNDIDIGCACHAHRIWLVFGMMQAQTLVPVTCFWYYDVGAGGVASSKLDVVLSAEIGWALCWLMRR
jgi:hypothetical protein